MEIQIDSKVDHIQFHQDVYFYAWNMFQHICDVAETVIFGSAQLNYEFYSIQHSMNWVE